MNDQEFLEQRVADLSKEVTTLKNLTQYGDDPNFFSLRTLTEKSIYLANRVSKLEDVIVPELKGQIATLQLNDRKSKNQITYWLIILFLTMVTKWVSTFIDFDYVKYFIGM